MIRSSLTLSALRDAAYALVLSCIDYCNSLYLNALQCELQCLQSLINTAVQVVSGRSRIDYITDFICDDLHWLPITQRVHFKVCSLVFNAIHGLAPNNITVFIVRSTAAPRRRDLRLSKALQLIPPSDRRLFAERAFAVGGLMLWNTLPFSVRDIICLLLWNTLPSSVRDIICLLSSFKVHLFKITFRV